jgi:hypothetical protein
MSRVKLGARRKPAQSLDDRPRRVVLLRLGDQAIPIGGEGSGPQVTRELAARFDLVCTEPRSRARAGVDVAVVLARTFLLPLLLDARLDRRAATERLGFAGELVVQPWPVLVAVSIHGPLLPGAQAGKPRGRSGRRASSRPDCAQDEDELAATRDARPEAGNLS